MKAAEIARRAVKWALFYGLCWGDARRYLRMRAGVLHLLARAGLYERRELRLLCQLVHAGEVVVDVGANFGVYTVALARLVGPTGRVWAFEPLKPVYERLVERTRAFPQVSALAVGLSDHAARRPIAVPLLFGAMPEPALASVEPLEGPQERMEIEVRPLDGYRETMDHIKFIKVDIEGHEAAFLTGARAVIERDRPVIQFEENDPERKLPAIMELARQLRYVVCAPDRSGRRLLSITAGSIARGNNYYLVPEEQADVLTGGPDNSR